MGICRFEEVKGWGDSAVDDVDGRCFYLGGPSKAVRRMTLAILREVAVACVSVWLSGIDYDNEYTEKWSKTASRFNKFE